MDEIIKNRRIMNDLVQIQSRKDWICNQSNRLRLFARDIGLEYIAETSYNFRDEDEDEDEDNIRPF